jgi:hypothetical protein
MEGIFAIAVACQMAFGKVDAQTIRKFRGKVDVSGGKETIIDANVADNPMLANINADPEDVLSVRVKVKLKAATVKGMFGKGIKANPLVDDHTNTLINKVGSLRSIEKIQSFMRDILTNNRPDEVIFYVIADGVQGGGGRGDIKGDVKLSIQAKTKTPIPMDISDPISFSLKVDDNTVSNLGIFSAVLKLGQMFDLDLVAGLQDLPVFPDRYSRMQELLYDHQDRWEDEEHIIYYMRNYMKVQDHYQSREDSDFEGGSKERKALQSTGELDALKTLVERLIMQFSNQLEDIDTEQFTADPRARVFTTKVFKFLEKEVFGQDDADLITIKKGDVKELKKSDFEDIKNDYVIDFDLEGMNMMFYGIDINNQRKLLFKIRPRLEYSLKGNRKTQLMMVELGDL